MMNLTFIRTAGRFLVIVGLVAQLETANAVEYEKLGTAVQKALGTGKAFKTTTTVFGKKTDVFYAKGPSGKATKFAVVQKRTYEPNCSHTWVIGLDAATANIEQIRVVEFGCPHAEPTKQASFLDQFKGKGPADAGTLKSDIHTIAKATGSSELTTDAAVSSITAAGTLKGKI